MEMVHFNTNNDFREWDEGHLLSLQEFKDSGVRSWKKVSKAVHIAMCTNQEDTYTIIF